MKRNVNPLENEQKKFADKIYQLLKRNLSESKIEQILQQVKKEFENSPSVRKLIDKKGRKTIIKIIEKSRRNFKNELYRYAGMDKKQTSGEKGKVEKQTRFEKDIMGWFEEEVISGCTIWQIIHQLDEIMDLGYNVDYLSRKLKNEIKTNKKKG